MDMMFFVTLIASFPVDGSIVLGKCFVVGLPITPIGLPFTKTLEPSTCFISSIKVSTPNFTLPATHHKNVYEVRLLCYGCGYSSDAE